jgi:murein L,D-transpeptidase YcbB/YkuD
MGLFKSSIGFCLCALLWAALARASPVPLADVAEELRQRFQADLSTQPLYAQGERLHAPVSAAQFYAQRAYQPAWLEASGPSPQATALVQALRMAGQEGLRPADYRPDDLERKLTAAGKGTFTQTSQWSDLDLRLTDTWLVYASHLLNGRLDPRVLDPRWDSPPRERDLAALLQQALTGNRVAETLAELSPANPYFERLRGMLNQYRDVAERGGWAPFNPGLKLGQGSRHPRVVDLRTRLRAGGDLTEADPSGAEVERYDDTVAQALRRFQTRHGLPANGELGATTLAALNVPVTERIRQLELNMERWRWLPGELGQRYILVNITDFNMRVVDKGEEVLDARVIVGKPERPTPMLAGDMSYLVLSPRWYVPPTIAVKDKLPQLRRNAYALSRQNIRVFALNGREVNPGSVNWSRVGAGNLPYIFRQDPGPRNALGRIKFIFPNPHDVYLHDTPSRDLFARSQRTFSSGCVRISKPFELAEYLLKDNPRWTRKAIVAAANGREQQIVNLAEKMPVYLFYWTAWVEADGTVQFRNDIYQRDKRLAQALFGSRRGEVRLTAN